MGGPVIDAVKTLFFTSVGFAAAGLLALLAPRTGRWRRPLTRAVALVAAVAGAAASPEAVGLPILDAAVRGGLCAATVLLATTASRWVLLVAAALAVAGTAGAGAAWVAAAALGMAVGGVLVRPEARLTKPIAAALVANAALRFEWPRATRSTAVLATVVLLVIAVSGYEGLRRRHRRRLRAAVGLTVALGAVAALLGVVATAQARPTVQGALRAANGGLAAASAGNVAEGAELLKQAAAGFATARDEVDAWWGRPALAVPVVAQNVRAVRAMARSGSALSESGARAVGSVNLHELQLDNGKVAVERIAALRGVTDEASAALTIASNRLQGVRSPWLAGPVEGRLDELSGRVRRARRSAQAATTASSVAPALLGAEGPRRYFMAIQSPSELRASGGFIGNYAEITADRGQLDLVKLGRTQDLNMGGDPQARRLVAPPDYTARYSRFDVDLLWQNVTMSPDFPTVAQVITSQYPQSGGRAIDGVVAIDPIALAAILNVIGPVQVAGWPVPISADNAVQVLLFEQYVRLQGDARVEFLGTATQAVWRKLTTSRFDVAALASALGPMVAEKHIQLASTRPHEQEAFTTLGAAGKMAPVRSDFIGVVTQNASGNKIDWFLRRAFSYEPRVDTSTGEVNAKLRITLRNDAPSGGLPPYIIGSATDPPLPPGSNKTYLSVYSPWLLKAARLDGSELLMETELELGRHVYSAYVMVPPGSTSTLELDLVGELDTTGRYELGVHRQPFLVPDEVSVSVVTRGRRHTETFPLTADRAVRLREVR